MSAQNALGNQFVTVYHASEYMRPDSSGVPKGAFGDPSDESRPEVMFAGTRRAAEMAAGFKTRPWIHELRVDRSAIDPTLYADDGLEPNMDDGPLGQTNIWEMTPIDTHAVAMGNTVGQYRNSLEDRGSTSFAIPRSALSSGAVQHVGVHPSRDQLESTSSPEDSLEYWRHVSSRRRGRGEYGSI